MRQRTSNGPAMGAVPQYQPPPPYEHHPSPPPYTPSANLHHEYGAAQARSPAGTPTRRSAVNRGPSSVGGIRPTEAPPMPPGVQQAKLDSPMGSRSGSASRESLPPPPLPPPLLPGELPTMGRITSPIHVNAIHQHDSPVRHTPSPQQLLRDATPDDLPLPSPPLPPSDGGTQSMPLPPLQDVYTSASNTRVPLPPPLQDVYTSASNTRVPLPPPLPPPVMSIPPDISRLPNGNAFQGQMLAPPADAVSISSNVSSTTVSSNSTVNVANNDKPAATIGCDLLNAIKDGKCTMFYTKLIPLDPRSAKPAQ